MKKVNYDSKLWCNSLLPYLGKPAANMTYDNIAPATYWLTIVALRKMLCEALKDELRK